MANAEPARAPHYIGDALKIAAVTAAFALPLALLLSQTPLTYLGNVAYQNSRFPIITTLLPLSPALMAMGLAVTPTNTRATLITLLNSASGSILIATTFLICMLQATTYGLMPIASFLILTTYVVFFADLWRSGDFDRLRIPSVITLVLVIFFAAAFSLYRIPNGRWWGGMHPNLVGSACVATACLSQFSATRLRILANTLAASVAILVSSRFAIACILPLLALAYLTKRRPLGVAALLGAILVCTFSLFAMARPGAFGALADSIFLLSDPTRGLGSGVSGRSALWANFGPQISTHPLLGFGFRNRAGYLGVHNGYGNLILEVGVVAGAIIISCILGVLAGAIKRLTMQHLDPTRRKVLLAQVGGLIACLIASSLQPQIFNFGDPLGVTFLALLGVLIAQSRRVPANRRPETCVA